jgi:hypothetical protein
MRPNPLHTGKAFEYLAHFLRRGRNFARRRVASRADLQREVHLNPPYRCYCFNSVQANHLEETASYIIAQGTKI